MGPNIVSILEVHDISAFATVNGGLSPLHFQTDTQIPDFEEIPCQSARPSSELKKMPVRVSPRLPRQENSFGRRSTMCERENMARVLLSKPSPSVFPRLVELE